MDRSVISLEALFFFLLGASSVISVNNQECNGEVECIPLDACTDLYRQLQQGTTPQLSRLLRRLHCGFVNNKHPKVCCPLEYLSTQINSDEVRDDGPNFIGGSGGGGFGQNRTWNSLTLLPNTSFCGKQYNDILKFGPQADLDEHPWTALLGYDKPRGRGFYCGGVLISKRYVLTAAHCVKNPDLPSTWRLSQVRLGEWNASSIVDCVGGDFVGDCNRAPLDIPLEEVITHDNYSASDPHQSNDIALIRLATDVPFNSRIAEFVKPICLPLTNELRVSDFNGYTFEVAGWGKTESRSESDVKLKARLPVMSKNECRSIYQKAERVITNSQLCASGLSGEDSCRVDSGGALMGYTTSAENWLVIGIFSYRPSHCGPPGWPGVYTKVGSYVDWILNKIRP